MASESSPYTRRWITAALVLALLVIAAGVVGLVIDRDQAPAPFRSLAAGAQVYDDTGSSISARAKTRIERRIGEIEQQDDIQIVAYVRTLDASPEDTLDQVADLQEQWSSTADADETRTVAILINRNPDDPQDARAGIYAGGDLVDGSLSEDDQADIAEQALIPPLAEGDVARSLTTGLDQIDTTLRENATPNAFQRWASTAGRTWVPWVSLALVLLGALYALRIFGRRVRVDVPEQRPTSGRPDDLVPAVGGALALGGPAASALPATIIDLANRGVLRIEPEGDRDGNDQASGQNSENGGEEPDAEITAVQIRLLDPSGVRGPVEHVVWKELDGRADGDVVRGKKLTEAAQQTGQVRDAVRYEMTERGWINPLASRSREALGVVVVFAGMVVAMDLVLLAAGEELLMLIGLVPATVLALAATVMIFRFSKLSAAGQHAAVSWQAYRDGLGAAVKDPHAWLDLEVAVPDLVATNQADDVEQLLERSGERGQALRAFSGMGRGQEVASMIPFWTVYSGAFTATSAAAGATVTGVAGGGGGGAAGST